MWTIFKIALLLGWFFLPGWAFAAMIGLFLYFAFFFAHKKKVAKPNDVPLPTWFTRENFKYVQENGTGLNKKMTEAVVRMGAEIQSRKKKAQQDHYKKDHDDYMINGVSADISHNLTEDNIWAKPEREAVIEKIPEHEQIKKINRFKKHNNQCPKCGVVFLTEHPQVCHLSDCYYQ